MQPCAALDTLSLCLICYDCALYGSYANSCKAASELCSIGIIFLKSSLHLWMLLAPDRSEQIVMYPCDMNGHDQPSAESDTCNLSQAPDPALSAHGL